MIIYLYKQMTALKVCYREFWLFQRIVLLSAVLVIGVSGAKRNDGTNRGSRIIFSPTDTFGCSTITVNDG